ncbi:transcriptional repressor [Actinomadura keratinilytica]|jgi:Fe2+ or Zn2+ uptake regulation protein
MRGAVPGRCPGCARPATATSAPEPSSRTSLARADGHLTADAIHEHATAADNLNLSAVYRTLALFERLHIHHTRTRDGRVTDHPHAHTVCDTCARVTALRDGDLDDLAPLVRRHLTDFAPTGLVIKEHCRTSSTMCCR